MSDSQFWAWTVLACLALWFLVALALAPIVGRLLARSSQPTLADRMRAAGEWEGS